VLVGVGAVFLAIAIGIPLGLAAGYTGGWLEAVIMRLLDAVLSFPMMILAIALVARLGSGFGNVILAIGLVTTPVFGRLAHASTLSAKQEEYVTGARAIGATDTRIMFRHILPSTFAPITVQAGANFAMALIAEATLSFLGMGTKAPDPSWGMMLNDARGYITDAPWLVFFPAAWISVAVLAVNFFADGLRDALDPHYRVE
jgi:peptide/nickel transport system permease protein